ncbi:MAG: hypothetical protein V8R80_10865 [Eubacterium sp.]
MVRSEEGYAKFEGMPQYYEAEYTYENTTKEYRLQLLDNDTDALGAIAFGESVSVKLQEKNRNCIRQYSNIRRMGRQHG